MLTLRREKRHEEVRKRYKDKDERRMRGERRVAIEGNGEIGNRKKE